VHAAQGVTAESTHAVLGENTTRSMLYVAMTRGRETNSAYIYETATEQEYGLNPLPGAHVMCRGTAAHAGRLARAIIANHDQPNTAHQVAAQTPSAALPEPVRRIHDRRAATLQRRRATYHSWQAEAQSFAQAMTTARERHNSRSWDQSLDGGIEV
jgi:ATP-dependent exoDNAse (exonuclease V) beta subunit